MTKTIAGLLALCAFGLSQPAVSQPQQSPENARKFVKMLFERGSVEATFYDKRAKTWLDDTTGWEKPCEFRFRHGGYPLASGGYIGALLKMDTGEGLTQDGSDLRYSFAFGNKIDVVILHTADKDMTARLAYALTVIRDECDTLAQTGF